MKKTSNRRSNSYCSPKDICRIKVDENGRMRLQEEPYPENESDALCYIPAVHCRDERGDFLLTQTATLRFELDATGKESLCIRLLKKCGRRNRWEKQEIALWEAVIEMSALAKSLLQTAAAA